MANCQNNMRYGRQGNMYMQRPSWNMQRNASRMEAERRAEEACKNAKSDTCGCRAEQREERREDRSGCGCRDARRECKEEKRDCGCGREDRLFGLPLAMAYVPWQRWNSIYDVCEALQRGTIFEELDKPFLGRGGCNR